MNLKDLHRAITTHYTALTVWRITLIYILLALLRGVFFIYNHDLIGEMSFGEIGSLMRGAFAFDTVSIIYANGLWLTLALLPIRLRYKRWYRSTLFGLYMVINTLLITVVNLADTIYFHYAAKRFSGDELVFTNNGNNSKLIAEFTLDNWWMLPLAALITYLLARCYVPRAKVSQGSDKWYLFYPLSTVALLVAATFAIGGIRGGLSRAVRPLTLSNAMDYTTDSNKAFMILSNPFCIIRTLGSEAIEVPQHFDEKRANELFSPYHYPTQESVAEARHKGYNVMLFILESFSAENSALLSPDLYEESEEGYMPYLDSLLREGVALHKNYANGTQSIAGTSSIIGSLPSLKKPFVLLPQSIGESYQMPAVLRDMGYTTSFFCGSERSSMGFAAYTSSAGVDNYFAREDYEAKHGYNDFDGAWGVWDDKFMQFVGEELTKMKEPFFASQFTISSHHPFNVPKEYADQLPKGKSAVQRGIAYTDLALRKFFERFKREEWFQHTIFVFCADHVSSEKMAPRTLTYPGTHHIVGGYYTPDGSLRGEVREVTQQLDFMPTILALLANDHPFFAFGRDIFDEESKLPRWSICYNGEVKAYDSDNNIVTLSSSDELKAFEQQYYKHINRRSYVVAEESEE